MPKVSAFPLLRTHKKIGKNGQVWVSYTYDMRGTGRDDIQLGTDREEAEKRWEILRMGGSPPPLRRGAKDKLPALEVKTRRKFTEEHWRNIPLWAKRLYLGAERRTKQKGKAVFLTLSQFSAIVARSAGKCEVSGVPLDIAGAGKRAPFSPSIDRIDAKLGYTAGNVRIVCLIANIAMSDWGVTPVEELAKALLRVRMLITPATGPAMLASRPNTNMVMGDIS